MATKKIINIDADTQTNPINNPKFRIGSERLITTAKYKDSYKYVKRDRNLNESLTSRLKKRIKDLDSIKTLTFNCKATPIPTLRQSTHKIMGSMQSDKLHLVHPLLKHNKEIPKFKKLLVTKTQFDNNLKTDIKITSHKINIKPDDDKRDIFNNKDMQIWIKDWMTYYKTISETDFVVRRSTRNQPITKSLNIPKSRVVFTRRHNRIINNYVGMELIIPKGKKLI